MLKVSFPDRETEHEAEALEHYAGEGAVRLLAADTALYALLLERLEPGELLLTLPDGEEADAIGAAVLRRLWRPAWPGHPLELVADRAGEWAETVPANFEALGRPFEPRLAAEAAALFAELGPSQGEQVVLHQDFHHGNVLSARREPWLAIDPKPLVGEREYDTGSLLRDRRDSPAGTARDERAVRRRLDFLSEELGLDRERMRGWGIAQAVMLGLWSLSVGDPDGEASLGCARILSAL